MHVLVLGAGVTGLTTAYCLARDGHTVTVVDREGGPGLGASYANGGQLSYSYVAPLASPGALLDLPFWLLDRTSPLRFRPQLDPHQWRWCLQFLMACTSTQSRRTTERLLTLALYSRALMEEFVAQTGVEFVHSRTGKLVVYSTEKGFRGGVAQMRFQERLGCEQRAVDAAVCLEIEPALLHIRDRLVGGIFTPSEQAGDCHRFCAGLESLLRTETYGVTFAYGRTASRFVCDRQRVLALETDQGVVEADAYVLALGAGSRTLARTAGLGLPIYPLKGYSLSVAVRDPAATPRVSVTDHARKIVYARLGDRLRVAGMADVVGYGRELDQDRLALLIREAKSAFPEASDYRRVEPWCGLRPATPTSKPMLGHTPMSNLLLNVGHGALGFTLAMGSARVIGDLVAGRRPAIPLAGFTVTEAQPAAGARLAVAS
ncbi:D-amino acid dehydrogenase [Azospirillum sp. TSO22-1]|uniref:D-amino acid dehydrogenase n=1 Tax=Azospirillum sp. TSO22-1 TaxID=716789 RepID=UPI000D60DC9C|nr:D-amino acid dehydrogenase [Azospirillum sp. TSO22-1]PWC56802.1 hypothetical protein TSO221_00770 [Azospirillum sp. TSO22-1]